MEDWGSFLGGLGALLTGIAAIIVAVHKGRGGSGPHPGRDDIGTDL